MGRWKKKDPHTQKISVVLNEAELSMIAEAMEAQGETSLSAFCRRAIVTECTAATAREEAMLKLIRAADRLGRAIGEA